ncbi:wings apart-like protein regulation of heterochromatin-domain-containing protein [Cladochytrium replicatum]|nr:wings apart-like protein regulation of heterochromatin-domain-containing protein [Cladochytrium replicatum]
MARPTLLTYSRRHRRAGQPRTALQDEGTADAQPMDEHEYSQPPPSPGSAPDPPADPFAFSVDDVLASQPIQKPKLSSRTKLRATKSHSDAAFANLIARRREAGLEQGTRAEQDPHYGEDASPPKRRAVEKPVDLDGPSPMELCSPERVAKGPSTPRHLASKKPVISDSDRSTPRRSPRRATNSSKPAVDSSSPSSSPGNRKSKGKSNLGMPAAPDQMGEIEDITAFEDLQQMNLESPTASRHAQQRHPKKFNSWPVANEHPLVADSSHNPFISKRVDQAQEKKRNHVQDPSAAMDELEKLLGEDMIETKAPPKPSLRRAQTSPSAPLRSQEPTSSPMKGSRVSRLRAAKNPPAEKPASTSIFRTFESHMLPSQDILGVETVDLSVAPGAAFQMMGFGAAGSRLPARTYSTLTTYGSNRTIADETAMDMVKASGSGKLDPSNEEDGKLGIGMGMKLGMATSKPILFADEGLDSSDDEETTKKKRDVRSLHELRQAGEMKRFNDEMEYILSGLSGKQPLNVKRTSYYEFSRKITSSGFLVKLRAHNFIGRVYEAMKEEEDSILLTCVAFILCILSQDPRNIENMVHGASLSSCLSLLVRIMNLNPDPLTVEMKNKYERSLVADIRDTIVSSSLLKDGNHITSRSLAIWTLFNMVTSPVLLQPNPTTSFRSGDSGADSIFSTGMRSNEVSATISASGVIGHLCGVINEWIDFSKADDPSSRPHGKEQRAQAHGKGGKGQVARSSTYDELEQCFDILHFLTVRKTETAGVIVNSIMQSIETERFCCLMEYLRTQAHNSKDTWMKASVSLHSGLRLLVNITAILFEETRREHASMLALTPRWSRLLLGVICVRNTRLVNAFVGGGSKNSRTENGSGAEADVSGSSGEKQSKKLDAPIGNFDVMVMAIGVLVNLLDPSVANREALIETVYCEQHQQCECVDKRTATSELIVVFYQLLRDDHNLTGFQEMDGKLLAAFLAVVFGCLLADHRDSRASLIADLDSRYDCIRNELKHLQRSSEMTVSSSLTTCSSSPAAQKSEKPNGALNLLILLLEELAEYFELVQSVEDGLRSQQNHHPMGSESALIELLETAGGTDLGRTRQRVIRIRRIVKELSTF